MGKIENTDAIASFSGYLYQSDVALFFVLKKIEEIGNDTNKLQDFSFEIEGEEDFGIFITNGDTIEKELFQVKEYNSSLSSKYMDAIMKLALNSKSQDGKHQMYLLTKTEISDAGTPLNNNDLIEKLKKSENEKVIELKKEYYYSKLRKEKKDKNEVNAEFLNYIENNEAWGKFIGNFKYEVMGDFENIKTKNLELIDKLKNDLGNENGNTNSLLYLLENYLKNFIQKNKGISPENREEMQFTEIIEILKIEKIDFEENGKEILINEFIKFFIDKFENIKPKYGIFRDLNSSLGGDFENFLENILSYISEKIFCDTEKTIYFIQTIVADKEFDNLENIKNVSDFSRKISKIGNTPINFLKIFLLYFHFLQKKDGINLSKNIDNFIKKDDKYFCIAEGDNFGKIVGLEYDAQYIDDFLNTEIYYQFEYTHLGIYNSENGKMIKDILITDGGGEIFDSEITKMHKKHDFDITKSYDVKFFNGQQYLKNNSLTFM